MISDFTFSGVAVEDHDLESEIGKERRGAAVTDHGAEIERGNIEREVENEIVIMRQSRHHLHQDLTETGIGNEIEIGKESTAVVDTELTGNVKIGSEVIIVVC